MKNSSKKQSTTVSVPNQKRVEYNVRIGNHLYQRISRHLLLLKHLKNTESKQKWVEEAIKEKLASEENSEEDYKDRFLHLQLEIKIWKAIQKKIDSLKSTRRSISKKVFIEEAIFQKLDREEQKSKELLKKLLNLSPE